MSPSVRSLSREESIWHAVEQRLPHDLSFQSLLLLKGKPLAGVPVLGQDKPCLGAEMIQRRKIFMLRLQAGVLQDLSALEKARLSVLAVLNTGELVVN